VCLDRGRGRQTKPLLPPPSSLGRIKIIEKKEIHQVPKTNSEIFFLSLVFHDDQ
jgi:hypothetical protein